MTQDMLQQQRWGAIALKQDCHKVAAMKLSTSGGGSDPGAA